MQTWQKLKNNPQLFKRYYIKEYVIKAVRKFFEMKGYHEFESPILADALPQERYLNILHTVIHFRKSKPKTAYLIPSTETFNKRLLAAGLGQHFTISKVFRELEEIGPSHSPEFTMLEWYSQNINYKGMMKQTEKLIRRIVRFIAQKIGGENKNYIYYKNHKIFINKPFYRFSIPKLVKKHFGIDIKDIQDIKAFRILAQEHGYKNAYKYDWDTIYYILQADIIEPMLPLDKPVFLYDFPRQVCPLTKVNKKCPYCCEKAELYINGMEIANIYTELIDWKEQKKRFLEEEEARNKNKMQKIKFDSELISALKSGLPDVSGAGLGIDRLAMLLANAYSISDVNYFPASELFPI